MKKIKNLMFITITILTIFIFVQNVFANQTIQNDNSNIIPITKNTNIDEIFPDLPKDSYLYKELTNKIENFKNRSNSKNLDIPNLAVCKAKTVSPNEYNIFFYNIGVDILDKAHIKATTTDSYGQFLGAPTFKEYGILPGFHRKNKVRYDFRPYSYALIDVQVTDKGQIHDFNFMHYRN